MESLKITGCQMSRLLRCWIQDTPSGKGRSGRRAQKTGNYCHAHEHRTGTRFMRRAQRTTISTKCPRAQHPTSPWPLPNYPPKSRCLMSYLPNSTAGVLFEEDEEKVTLHKTFSWVAHWACLIASFRKPPAIAKDTEEASTLKPLSAKPSTSTLTTQPNTEGRQQDRQLVERVLSRELQLYHAKL